MIVKLIGYPSCSTCKKAIAYAKQLGFEVIFQHIVDDTPSIEELEKYWKNSGVALRKMFNTSGNLYKEMKLKDKLQDMSEEEQLHLLSAHGMLIKRPILVTDEYVIIGFKKEEYEKLSITC